MRTTVGRLRKLVAEAMVTAHPSYMKKERMREALQAMVLDAVRSGDVKDQKGLNELVSTITMALNALKMVPFEVYDGMVHDGR